MPKKRNIEIVAMKGVRNLISANPGVTSFTVRDLWRYTPGMHKINKGSFQTAVFRLAYNRGKLVVKGKKGKQNLYGLSDAEIFRSIEGKGNHNADTLPMSSLEEICKAQYDIIRVYEKQHKELLVRIEGLEARLKKAPPPPDTSVFVKQIERSLEQLTLPPN